MTESRFLEKGESERLREHWAQVGHPPCPVCGQGGWILHHESVTLGGLEQYQLACTTCGAVQHIVKSIVGAPGAPGTRAPAGGPEGTGGRVTVGLGPGPGPHTPNQEGADAHSRG